MQKTLSRYTSTNNAKSTKQNLCLQKRNKIRFCVFILGRLAPSNKTTNRETVPKSVNN